MLVASAFALRVSVWLSLALVLPAAGFLTRTFIVFHDCTHGSFMRSRRANDAIGVVTGLLVWLPYRGWQHEHAVHHATAGDLDRRGVGDVATLTVAEYDALPRARQIKYRLYRSPFVMFGLGWLLVLVLNPRFVPDGAKPRVRNSVLLTDLLLALIVAGGVPDDRLEGLPPRARPRLPRRRRRRRLAVLRPAPVRGHVLADARRLAVRPRRARRELVPEAARPCCASSPATSASTTSTT